MGLAKSMKSKGELNSTFAGTPLAMAPELINGYKYSVKADVWSLGTLLYQILMDKRPFTGKTLDNLKHNQQIGNYKLPSGISIDCADFITKCLRFDSDKRADWEELLDHAFFHEEVELAKKRGFNQPLWRQSMDININASVNLARNR